jgi:hypothetical protein
MIKIHQYLSISSISGVAAISRDSREGAGAWVGSEGASGGISATKEQIILYRAMRSSTRVA